MSFGKNIILPFQNNHIHSWPKTKNMKKHTSTIYLAVILLTALLLTSCNSAKKEFELTADSPGIKGGLKDYIDIAPGSYKLTLDESKHEFYQGNECKTYNLTIKLISKQKTDKSFQEIANPIMTPLSVTILDDKGSPPSFAKASYSGGTDNLKKLLKDGEENFFEFSFCCSPNDIKNVNLAKFFVNTNATEFSETTTTSSSGNDESVSSTGSQDWDKILKEYAEYTDKYIALMKKVKNNDATAMSEYQDMYNQAEKLGNDLEKGQGNLSPAQLNKMMEIQTKLANAAMEMAKQ
jgi:hypothetical protein